MKKLNTFIFLLIMSISLSAQTSSSSPIIPEADGFITIPNAKLPLDKSHIYKAIFDATKAARDSAQILPALDMVGSELNAFGVSKIPVNHAKFVVVFHGSAINGILNNNEYKQKFGIANPNLKVLNELKKAGVKLFVCGQNLLEENIDSRTISPDVEVASDALIVSMTYQNNGYALLSF
jgi:intracellular sulfur oxidation DsrE/DsrF family protein